MAARIKMFVHYCEGRDQSQTYEAFVALEQSMNTFLSGITTGSVRDVRIGTNVRRLGQGPERCFVFGHVLYNT